MPLTIKRTNITSIAANSVLFNGSSQYLSTPSDSNFTFGTGSFTMEFWCNYTLSSTQNLFSRRFLSQGANSLTRFQIWTADTSYTANSVTTVAGGILLAHNNPSVQLVGSVNAYNDGSWHHVAFTRGGGTLYCFVDGVLKQSVSNSTNFSAIDPMYIAGKSDGGRFAGYISNLRIVKGTALYTASFTAPTTPLTAIANTSLLTCNAATIVDSSTNNFTITNNGSATVSSINPFRASTNNFQFVRRTPTIVGKSVLFDGTNDYLSVARILDNSTDVTIEAWVRVTSASDAYIVAQYVVGSVNRTIFSVNSTLKVGIQIGSTSVNSVAAITLNTWYHLAWVRSGSGANNFSIYINGVRDGQMTYTGTFHNTPTTIGGSNNYDAYGSSYFSGYISNLRILKGTALYTGASFSVPTSPLTAIANTSLLTCNAATIVDSSTNNFTITNNNGATVSSVSPFVASGGGMSLKKVFADPATLVTNGLVLNLDASNASSYPGSGTSWFDLSGNSNNGTLTNGPTFNSANGGSIVFDGSNDYVSSFPTQISGVGSKTVSAWIKINKTSRVGLAGIRDGGSQTGWVFTVNRTTYGNLTYFHTGGSALEVAAGIITNTWYNVCVTYNLTSTTAILYLNGVQIGSPSTSFTAITPSSFKGVVGNEDSAFSDLFSGNIAQALIYNRALTASEVLQNYNVTRAKFGL